MPARAVGLPLTVDGDSISSLRFGPTNVLAASGWDSKTRFVEYSDGKEGADCMKVVLETKLPAPALDSDWAGERLVVGDTKGNIKVTDLRGNNILTKNVHDAGVKGVRAIDENSIVTVGWDSTLKIFDLRAPVEPQRVEALPSSPVSMDAKGMMCVVAHLMSEVSVYNMAAAKMFYRSSKNTLKYQQRAVATFADESGFCVSSIEGRCAVRYTDAARDNEGVGGVKSFAFKCHRRDEKIFSVNAICFSSSPAESANFFTVGGDGYLSIWNRDRKHRVSDERISVATDDCPSITTGHWGGPHNFIAIAHSYDWAAGSTGHRKWKGREHILLYDPAEHIRARDRRGPLRR